MPVEFDWLEGPGEGAGREQRKNISTHSLNWQQWAFHRVRFALFFLLYDCRLGSVRVWSIVVVGLLGIPDSVGTNPQADDGKLRSIVVRFMCLLILSLSLSLKIRRRRRGLCLAFLFLWWILFSGVGFMEKLTFSVSRPVIPLLCSFFLVADSLKNAQEKRRDGGRKPALDCS